MGPVERWVDAAHVKGGDLVQRIVHAMRCMDMYVRIVIRPQKWEMEAGERRERNKRQARWRICAMLVRIDKDEKQRELLEARQLVRAGLVCANTRDAGRVTTRGGVNYDETRRSATRIQVPYKISTR